MPSARPMLSTWISWPLPTATSSLVNGANGSERWLPLPASASGAIGAIRFQGAAGKIAVDEARDVAGRLDFRHLEDLVVHRRQGAGRIGVAGVAGQGKSLATTSAEIDFLEFAALARLRHPPGAAIAVEGLGVLPDPGDRMI